MHFSALILGALSLAGLTVGGIVTAEPSVTSCASPITTTVSSCGYNTGNLQPTCRTWIYPVCPTATTTAKQPDEHWASLPVMPTTSPCATRGAVRTPPLCCFDLGSGMYQCPCNKASAGESNINPCDTCFVAIHNCKSRCKGNSQCIARCNCKEYFDIPMCKRCPAAKPKPNCGNIGLTNDAVEARVPPPEILSTRGPEIPAGAPTTLATMTTSQDPKAKDGQVRYCSCYTCPPRGGCRWLPCWCGSANAAEVN